MPVTSVICFLIISLPHNKKAHPEGCAEKVSPSGSLPHYTDKCPSKEKERTPFTKVLLPLTNKKITEYKIVVWYGAIISHII